MDHETAVKYAKKLEADLQKTDRLNGFEGRRYETDVDLKSVISERKKKSKIVITTKVIKEEEKTRIVAILPKKKKKICEEDVRFMKRALENVNSGSDNSFNGKKVSQRKENKMPKGAKTFSAKNEPFYERGGLSSPSNSEIWEGRRFSEKDLPFLKRSIYSVRSSSDNSFNGKKLSSAKKRELPSGGKTFVPKRERFYKKALTSPTNSETEDERMEFWEMIRESIATHRPIEEIDIDQELSVTLK